MDLNKIIIRLGGNPDDDLEQGNSGSGDAKQRPITQKVRNSLPRSPKSVGSARNAYESCRSKRLDELFAS